MIDPNDLTGQYFPEYSILVHKTTTINSNGMEYYLEFSKLNGNGEAASYQPFRIKDLSMLYGYLKSVHENQITIAGGAIPKNLMYIDTNTGTYIWYVKGKRRAVTYDKELKIRGGMIQYPDMVFKASGEKLWVYFCKTKGVYKSGLYLLPFMNTYEEGNVCLGNIKLDSIKRATNIHELMAAWENIYYNSAFSHGAGGSEEFMKLITNRKTFPWHLSKKFRFRKVSLQKVYQ